MLVEEKSYKTIERIFTGEEVFCAFDLETTGLYPGRDRIIEIGAQKFTLSEKGESFNQLINSDKVISPKASQINGISNEMIQNQPPIEEILPKFIDFISGTILVAHSAAFDKNFINHALKRLLIKPSPKNKIICSLHLARKAFPARKSYSLGNLVRDLEIHHEQAHRAYSDALACANVFLHCLHKLKKSPLLFQISS